MGSSTINLTNTAYNVSFNWTLSTGITNSTGTLVKEFTNITNNSLLYNNIEATFSDLESMTSGTNTIYLYASGINLSGDAISDANNNTLLTQQANISFLCYNTSDNICVEDCGYDQDPDCPQATSTTTTVTTGSGSDSGGGGGGGGAGDTIERSDAYFELLAGKIQEFQLPIENKLTSVKRNISIKIEGLNSKFIETIPKTIPEIKPKSSKNLTIKITAPAYFTKGEHKLIFYLTGDLILNGTQKGTFSEKKTVTLYIVEVSREEADEILAKAKKLIQEMNQSEMKTKEVNKLLENIKLNYKDIDFINLKNNFEQIKTIHNAGFKAKEILENLNRKINNAETSGIEIIETKKILYIAEASYNRGDYLLALEKLEQAELTFALETKGEINLLYTIKNNPVKSSLALAGIMFLTFTTSLGIRYRLLKRKYKMLEEEEKLLLQLMSVVQKECFEKSKMSMEEYREAMSQYEKKLGKTIEEKINTETKINNLAKVKGKKKALNQERNRLIELIKKTQDDYLNKAKIETRIYDNMIRTYSKRLSEIEEQITFLEANEALKNTRFFRRLFRRFKRR